MKRIAALTIAVIMILSTFSVFADEADANAVETVLLKVKSKINVPFELTEFSVNTTKNEERETFHFSWRDEGYENYMSVSADAEGRIISYNNDTFDYSDKKIPQFSKEDFIKCAEEFLKTTVPEAFISENDRLFFDNCSYAGRCTYAVNFKRLKDGVFVKDNYAYVFVVECDGEIKVNSMSVTFDYDAVYDEEKPRIDNITERYKELYPVEMVYYDDYMLYRNKKDNKISNLIYRIKDGKTGYMDVSTGEMIEEDPKSVTFKNEAMMDSAAGGGGGLTEQELKEIDEIQGLLSETEIMDKVKSLPYVRAFDNMTLTSKRLYKNADDKYFCSLNYDFGNENYQYEYLRIKADAKTGELAQLYCNGITAAGEDYVLTDEQIKDAEAKINEFLTVALNDKFSQTVEEEREDYQNIVHSYFGRVLNGVKYVNNGITISFCPDVNIVYNLNVNFTEGEFENPADAISGEEAYAKILEYAPITEMYILSGGIYKKAVILEKNNVTLNAISGEIRNKQENVEYSYDDIENHWVKTAATKLAEIDLGFTGGKLEPEKEVDQEEFLRFVTQAIVGYGNDYPIDEFYEKRISDGIVKEEEKNPGGPVKREDAFVYIIRYAGLERVAQLTDIFKVNFADESEVSKEKLGYAAILSGFGVVNGNGGYLRPQENLTRAEALSFVYKYLLSF